MLAALLAAVLATAPEAPASDGDPQVHAAAREAFERARAHAAAGSYDAAIELFEHALRLRPSPGLHYNIAVCHHRLLLAADKDSQTYEAHRAAAVDAYNAYLDAAPDAPDRYAVAATIQDLHGRPSLIDEWRIDDSDPGRASLELRDEEAEDTATDEAAPTAHQPQTPSPSHPPPPARTPMRPGFPHGMLALGLGIEAPSPVAMASSAGIDSVPALGPTLRGGGFIGAKRELLLGGEFAWSSTTTPASRGHRITTLQFLLLVDWARAVGSEHFEIGLSTTVGLGGQTMAHKLASPATCPVRASGVVSSRGGFLVGTRLLLRATFGTRGRHAFALRTGPSGTLFGGGSKDANCLEGGPSPFSEYGIPEVSLLVRTDLSYALRW